MNPLIQRFKEERTIKNQRTLENYAFFYFSIFFFFFERKGLIKITSEFHEDRTIFDNSMNN